ncbi:ATP-binding protein [Kutzneria sp. NPDC052558]|uniref:HAMP domain-containing sensor histidine kinase n=1 Tax=Kutzneria sp. NPDC052558 TaxID=3364121 RepID=UPI0037CAEC2E
MKLRTQLALGVALVALVVIGLAGLVIALRIQQQDLTQVDQDLSTRVAKVGVDACKAGSEDRSKLAAGSQTLVRVLSNGSVIAWYGDVPSGTIPAPTLGFSTVPIGEDWWRSYAENVPCGQVQVLESLAPVDERLAANAQVIAGVAGVAMVLVCLGVWLVAGLVLSPLQRLRAGAARIRTGHDLEHRLPPVRRPQEVAELSATLNEMLDGLRTSMLATRRFTADAGHELRTPLASLGIDLESLRRNPDLSAEQRAAMLAAMTREHSRVVELLEGLQTLARGDAGALPTRVPVDLGELVGNCVTQARRRHPATDFHLSATPGPMVDGWPEGLRLAVDNLLDNAAVHGALRVDVTLTANTISVSDNGPGIPAELRDDMKRRFVRGPETRAVGSGLGLALVDQQACLHGGVFTLDRSDAGGLKATITLSTAGE